MDMPQGTPIKLVIMQRLTAMLEQIPIPGGQPAADFTGRVYRGRIVIGGETKTPYYTILEAPKPDLAPVVAGIGSTIQTEEWQLLIQGFGVDDKLNPTDHSYYMEALARMRLSQIIAQTKQGHPAYPDDYRIPYNGKTLINDLILPPGVVRPPSTEVSPTAFCYIALTIKMKTDSTNTFIV